MITIQTRRTTMSHHANRRNNALAPPRRQLRSQGRKEEGAANPSLERESALYTTCQAVIGQSNWSTGQLVNWSKSAVNSGQNCKNG